MTIVALVLLSTLVVMSGASLSASLPAIGDHFSSVPNVRFLVRLLQTIPALFIVISAPIAGVLIDRKGRKLILILGTILFGFSGTAGFFIRSIWGLLVSRAFLGVGAAIIYTGTTALISDYFHKEERAKFLGLQSGIMAFSGVVFPLLGGVLTDIGWNFTFLSYAVAFLYLPLAIIYIFEPDKFIADEDETEKKVHWLKIVPTLPLMVIFGLTFIGQIIFYITPVQLSFYLRDMNITSNFIISIFVASISLSMSLSGLAYGWIKKRLSYPKIVIPGFWIGCNWVPDDRLFPNPMGGYHRSPDRWFRPRVEYPQFCHLAGSAYSRIAARSGTREPVDLQFPGSVPFPDRRPAPDCGQRDPFSLSCDRRVGWPDRVHQSGSRWIRQEEDHFR